MKSGLPDKTTHYWWDVQISNRYGNYIEAYHKIAIDKVVELLSHLHDKKVLDFGCGSGNWSLYLSTYNFTTVGVDIDKEAINIYQNRVPNSEAILTSPNTDQIPLGDNTMDLLLVISLSQIFTHDWFIKEAYRIIKPGGYVVGTLQNRLSWRGQLQKFKSMILKTENPFKISFNEFKNRAEKEGFHMIFSRGFGWIPIHSTRNNSILIPIFGFLEWFFLLGYIRNISPMIVFILKKSPNFINSKGDLLAIT